MKGRKRKVLKPGVEIKTVKSGLQSVLKDKSLLTAIREDVTEISRLMYEASRLIYFDLNRKLVDEQSTDFESIDFTDYFYQLLDGAKAKYSLSEEYSQMRNQFGLRKYDRRYKGNLFMYAAQNYTTVFNNNIWMHAKSRMKRVLYKMFPETDKKEIWNCMKYLFFTKPQTLPPVPSEMMQERIRKFLNFEPTLGYFRYVKSRPASYLKLFHTIQSLNESNEWKNFNLIPLYTAGLKHVTYDQKGVYSLLSRLKMVPKKVNEKGTPVNIAQAELHMTDYFNFKKNFQGTFTTDGVSVCVKYLKRAAIESTGKRMKPDNFDSYIGIDPGCRLFVAAVKREQELPEINFKISNKTYQHTNGYYERKTKLKKYIEDIDEKIERARQTSDVPLIYKGNAFFKDVIAFDLRWMTIKQLAYCQFRIARLKLDKCIRVSSTIASVVKTLLGSSKRMACFFGNATMSSNSPVKGYIRLPNKELKKELIRHPNITVIDTDEHRTTKLCSDCFGEMNVSESPHRFVTCPSCKKTWNRDTNAANNILKNGLCVLRNICLPLQFSRSFIL